MRTLLALAALATSVSPLAGQSLAELCRGLADRIAVGQWAEYRMTGQQGTMQIRFAVVGKETVAGKEHLWFELKMNSDQGAIVTQALVPGFPYDQENVQSMVMKMGDQPAMKLPKSMLSMAQGMQRGPNPGAGAASALKKCESAEVIGHETIEVPAGRIETTHFRTTEAGQKGDGWVSAAVPFGLVKMTFDVNGSGEMVLLAHGKDAKSSITETPREMPGMPGR
jgi:hypothetical protein